MVLASKMHVPDDNKYISLHLKPNKLSELIPLTIIDQLTHFIFIGAHLVVLEILIFYSG